MSFKGFDILCSVVLKNIKSKIYSDLQRECMRDIRYRLGADWLPSVMGLVESYRAEADAQVSSL